MPQITMPRLSEEMEEGTILGWLKRDGEVVGEGEGLVEIEADKVRMTYDSPAAGVVSVVAEVGATLPVGAVIASVGDADTQAAPAPARARGDVVAEEPTRAEQVWARRVSEARATIPDVQLQAHVDLGAAAALVDQLRGTGQDVDLGALVVRAAALALRGHPRANGAWRDGRFERYTRVNVALALGSALPVVADADARTLPDITTEMRRLIERVRSGTLTSPEQSGPTFTVTDLSAEGVEVVVPVVVPGQAAGLGVGAGTLTLVSDARILHGTDAAAFLTAVRSGLERPLGLALDSRR